MNDHTHTKRDATRIGMPRVVPSMSSLLKLCCSAMVESVAIALLGFAKNPRCDKREMLVVLKDDPPVKKTATSRIDCEKFILQWQIFDPSKAVGLF